MPVLTEKRQRYADTEGFTMPTTDDHEMDAYDCYRPQQLNLMANAAVWFTFTVGNVSEISLYLRPFYGSPDAYVSTGALSRPL